VRHCAIALITLLCARVAWPCSFDSANFDGPAAPNDTRAGVPRNARLVVDISHPFDTPVATAVTLTAGSGTVLQPAFSTVGSLFIARPQLLEPSTSYTFEIASDSFGEAMLSTRTFTTSTAEDTRAPVIDGELAQPTNTYVAKPPFGLFDSCGPIEDSWYVDLDYPELSDDMGIAGVNIYTVDDNGGRTLRKTDLDGFRGSPSIRFTEPGTYTFQIEVFDLAGNATSSNEVTTILQAAIVSCSATHATTTTTVPWGACAALAMIGFSTVRRKGRRARASTSMALDL
jgi:hypothetical protein